MREWRARTSILPHPNRTLEIPLASDARQTLPSLLEAASQGDRAAADALMPLIYDELRALAMRQIAHEPAGLTLQPTALVHEAYLRLGDGKEEQWQNKRHFFAAAALAMRRILVERGRRKAAVKHGAERRRITLDDVEVAGPADEPFDWLELDQALSALYVHDAELAEIVSLRYFVGLSVDDTAQAMGLSSSTVDRFWRGAKAFLLMHMDRKES